MSLYTFVSRNGVHVLKFAIDQFVALLFRKLPENYRYRFQAEEDKLFLAMRREDMRWRFKIVHIPKPQMRI